ncbi:unannotated protein [freshwater metagenome]|uniref:Unannotated protein n=1 Tax=freshwater metagenome TaxID=449393 RepID=A0A6J7KM23_9ZZZZ
MVPGDGVPRVPFVIVIVGFESLKVALTVCTAEIFSNVYEDTGVVSTPSINNLCKK